MNDMNITGFLANANSYQGKKAQWMGILVTLPGHPAPQMIIDPIDNAEQRVKYIASKYDENLRMMGNPDIQIVRYAFTDTLAELISRLD